MLRALLQARSSPNSRINLTGADATWRLIYRVARASRALGTRSRFLQELATWPGCSALHFAMVTYSLECVGVLVGAKADATLKNDIGWTPARFSLEKFGEVPVNIAAILASG